MAKIICQVGLKILSNFQCQNCLIWENYLFYYLGYWPRKFQQIIILWNFLRIWSRKLLYIYGWKINSIIFPTICTTFFYVKFLQIYFSLPYNTKFISINSTLLHDFVKLTWIPFGKIKFIYLFIEKMSNFVEIFVASTVEDILMAL